MAGTISLPYLTYSARFWDKDAMQYERLRGRFSIYFEEATLQNSRLLNRGWARFINWYFHEEVGGAYRKETTVNQVIGHGIEFSLPAADRSSSWSSYRATAPGVV